MELFPITPDRPLTVAALSQKISSSLADLGMVLVQGELSQAKVHTSGHFYATLKDSEAVISLVMWRSTVVRNGPIPKEGSRVLVRGSVTVYAVRGQYQITATRITPLGQGDLAARFEALKARLLAEGLFDEERKRPLPSLPRAVGLATAAGSAALADLVQSLRERFPNMPIVHAPCPVQGAEAAAGIIAALGRLERHPEVDVIICGRGGGSIEDLWAFNEEAVVRAIAACRKPVVSAVGHETDTTLADFAADVRAKTPTAAAELVVPIEADLRQDLADQDVALREAMAALIDDYRRRLAALASHRALAGPGYQLALRRQRLDEISATLEQAVAIRLDAAHNRAALVAAGLRAADPGRRLTALQEALPAELRRLVAAADRRVGSASGRSAALAGRLDALSPLAVIARGYSVVRGPDGRVVRTLADAPPGTVVDARLLDGWLKARVEGGRKQRLNEPGDLYDADEKLR